jgi:hypothetical protein
MQAFEYWLKLQEHKWNERNKRRSAINDLRGSDLTVLPFPVIYSAEENTIKRIDGEIEYIVDNSDDFMEFVEQLIWGES